MDIFCIKHTTHGLISLKKYYTAPFVAGSQVISSMIEFDGGYYISYSNDISASINCKSKRNRCIEPSVISSTSPLSPKHLDRKFSSCSRLVGSASSIVISSISHLENRRVMNNTLFVLNDRANNVVCHRKIPSLSNCEQESKVDALSEFPCWRARLFGHHLLTPSSAIACFFRTAILSRLP